MKTLRPELLWHRGQWIEGGAVSVDEATGRIREVHVEGNVPDSDMRGVALMPGFVNAHSHAFQFGLRGHVQARSGGAHFFSWREGMFALADGLDPQGIYELSRQAFTAMRAAGYTAVGEFHYVHHRPDGTPFEGRVDMAAAVLEAARGVGLRCCLLNVAYFRPSGVSDVPPSPGQVRFCDPNVDAYLARHHALEAHLDALADPRLSLGIAPHSTRAVGSAELSRIGSACPRGPVHVHINEQPREIEESLAEYGVRPLEVLVRAGLLGERTTLVHMTHATQRELVQTVESGASICFCPTTERDLGDGIGPSRAACALGVDLCIGSDSQTQIEPLAELRLLEGHERLRAQARLQLAPPGGVKLGSYLLRVGTRAGARALQLDTGEIEPGRWADFVEIDLNDPDLSSAGPEQLADVLCFSATPRVVRGSWVAGARLE